MDEHVNFQEIHQSTKAFTPGAKVNAAERSVWCQRAMALGAKQWVSP
jgi:hypothetical protein